MRRTVLFSLAAMALLVGGLMPRLVQGDSTSTTPLQILNIAAQAQKDGSLVYRICVTSDQSSLRGDVTLASSATGATTDIVLTENGYSCGLPNSYLLQGSQTFSSTGQSVTYQFVQVCVVDAGDVVCLSRNQPLLSFGLTVFPDCSVDVSVNSAGLATAPTVILPCLNGEGSLTSTLALTATPTPTETAASCMPPQATATTTATVPANATASPTGMASVTATATSPPPTHTPTATPRPPTATPTSFGTPIPLPWQHGASPHVAAARDLTGDATATVTGTVSAPLPQCTATDTPVAATATVVATTPGGASASATATASQTTASSQGSGTSTTGSSGTSAPPVPTNTAQPPATSTATPVLGAVGTTAGAPAPTSPTRTSGTGVTSPTPGRLLVTLNAYELRPRDILLIHIRYHSHTAIQAMLTYATRRSVRVSGRTGSKGLLTLRLRVPQVTLAHGHGTASLRVIAVPTAFRATYATRITLSDMILSTRTAQVKACTQQLSLRVAYYAKAPVQLSVSYLNRQRLHVTTGTDRHGNLVRKVALSYLALKPDKLLISVVASGRHGAVRQTERSQLLVKVPAACRSS